MASTFDINCFDFNVFDGNNPVPSAGVVLWSNVVFKNDAFQCNVFQWANNPNLSSVFVVVLYEIRMFSYMVVATTDAQALILAKSINPTAPSLPANIVLQTGPHQSCVGVASITDQFGSQYFTCIPVNPLPTPAVKYIPSNVIGKLYSVSIQENRHTNYSFVGTQETLSEVIEPLNPSANVDPVGGKRTTQPIADQINVLSVVEITSGIYRNVFNANQ